MRNYINKLIVLAICAGAWFAMSCTEDMVCKFDDNGEGAALQAPESNPCGIGVNDQSYQILPLTNATTVANFDVDKFVADIAAELNVSVKGWQLAVGYDDKVIRATAGGLRSGSKDCPSELEMTACTKMNIGSQTKAIICAAIINLLDEAGLDPSSEVIKDYLPTGWADQGGSDFMTFGSVLGHRSGYEVNAAGNTKDDVKAWYVAGPTNAPFEWVYLNAHYSFMRELFPKIYEKVRDVDFTEEEVSTHQQTSALLVNFLENEFIQPLGNPEPIISWPDDGSRVYYFDDINDNDGEQRDFQNIGAGTLSISVVNMVKFYMELWNGTKGIISPNVKNYMVEDGSELGINRFGFTTGGPINEEYYGHGGTISNYFSNTLVLPGNLFVSLGVNSCFQVDGSVTEGNQCNSFGVTQVILNHYRNAFN
ncbi:MAG: serine hydrolase domain-containing protein [Chitinophagales bacterium]